MRVPAPRSEAPLFLLSYHRPIVSLPSLVLRIVAIAILGCHVWLAISWLGAGRSAPVVQDDYALHLASAETSRETWRVSGRFWGWDPGSMAGHPAGTWDSLSNHAGMLGVALLGFLPAAQAFSLSLMLASILPLLAAWGSAAALGWPLRWRLATMLVFLALYWAMLTEPGAFLAYGMYGFAVMICLVPLFLGLVDRTLRKGSSRATALGPGVISALGTLLHPFFLLITGGALMLSWLSGAERRRLAPWSLVAGTTVLGGLVSLLPWMGGLRHTRWALVPTAPFFQDTLAALRERLSAPEVLIWLLGSVGIWLWWREPERRGSAILFGSTASLLLVVGGFGSRIAGASALEPARFLGALSFVLALPALAVVRRAASFTSRVPRLAPLALVLAALVPGLFAAYGVATGSERLLAWTGGASGDGRLPSDLVELVEALPGLVSPDARLMTEDSDHDREGHKWGDGHLLALLPRMIGREVIGGPMEESRLAHHFVDFTHGRFLGRALRNYKDGELRERLGFLNVGTIVAWSGEALEDLASRPFLTSEATFGRYRVFGVTRLPSWFPDEPSARIVASIDRIEVTGAPVDPDGPLVLPYHWDTAWVSEPDMPLARVDRFGDPVGFIGVDNGPIADFVLRYEP